MAASFGDAIADTFKSFWHTMTSNDRHSTYNSPYRTGRHVPLNGNNGMGPLTSVATASESRADLTSPYRDEAARSSTGLERRNTAYEGAGASPGVMSPGGIRPYSPGLRSESARRHSQQNDNYETQSNGGEIPMQSFQDGLPPPPPVTHSWQRIDAWTEDNYPELTDQICEGCTTNDLNELEHMLDCSLPMEIRESLQIHDGQERGGLPTGIIFGSMLLDCEEIVQEWQNWKTVNQEFLLETSVVKPTLPTKAFGGGLTNGGGGSSQASSSRDRPPRGASPAENPNWRQELNSRQDCVPPNAVKKSYAHPAWIPLVRDWGGNNLAVDLAPGPTGTWGQIIMFGRDYDTKYVVARSWAAFLALVADDMNSGKWFIDEDNGELKLREFKSMRVEPGYFDILRWRMDQKYGRRVVNKRKSVVPGQASPTGSGSPYASPTEPSSEVRGRPLQRLSASSPLASPNRPGYGKPSPLSQVAEEAPAAAPAALPELTIPNGNPRERLVEVDTPRVSDEDHALANGMPSAVKASSDVNPSSPLTRANGKRPAVKEDTMKTIEI